MAFKGYAGRSAIVFLGVLSLVGCATTAAPQRPAQETVAERAQQRWNAMVASDFEKAYEFLSPAGKSIVTKEGYKTSLKQGFWTGAQVKKVECASDELCEVHLEIEYEYVGRKTRTPLAEKWIKQDSQWWYLLENAPK